MPRHGAERDERFRGQDAVNVHHVVGDHVRELVIGLAADNGHDVEAAAHGIDLAHAFDIHQLLGQIVDLLGLGIDEQNRGDHGDLHAVVGL